MEIVLKFKLVFKLIYIIKYESYWYIIDKLKTIEVYLFNKYLYHYAGNNLNLKKNN